MKITKLEKQLLNELKTIREQLYSKCNHGGIRYPINWMKKTKEKAIAKGFLIECNECRTSIYQYLLINTDALNIKNES